MSLVHIYFTAISTALLIYGLNFLKYNCLMISKVLKCNHIIGSNYLEQKIVLVLIAFVKSTTPMSLSQPKKKIKNIPNGLVQTD